MCSVEGEEDGGEKYEGKNVVDVSVVKGGGRRRRRWWRGKERKGKSLVGACGSFLHVCNQRKGRAKYIKNKKKKRAEGVGTGSAMCEVNELTCSSAGSCK